MEFMYNETNLLVIENCKQYRVFVNDLLKSIEEEDDICIFSDSESILKKSKTIDVITSVFEIDYNNKKIQKFISDELYKLSVDEEHYEKSMELLNEIERYLYELEWALDYEVDISSVDFHDVIKAGINGLVVPESIIEKVLGYIRVSAVLLKSKIIILVGIQNCFTFEEWKLIEEKAALEEIILFCIESKDIFKNKKKNKVIIDNDECRVL